MRNIQGHLAAVERAIAGGVDVRGYYVWSLLDNFEWEHGSSMEFIALTKVFDDGTVAVDALDLAVEDGEFVVLVGPSGSGKTTVLRMAAGLETPTSGEVRIGGEPVNDVDPQDRNVAMVFQSYALYPHMTVYDNMGFGLRLHGLRKREIRERVQHAAEMLGLAELHDDALRHARPDGGDDATSTGFTSSTRRPNRRSGSRRIRTPRLHRHHMPALGSEPICACSSPCSSSLSRLRPRRRTSRARSAWRSAAA